MRYSFQNFYMTLNGPGGSVNLGFGAAVAEEGIEITPVGDKNVPVTGSDGQTCHQLMAGEPCTVKIRLMKTSPQNAIMNTMYNLQTADVALHGINAISGRHVVQGDYFMGIQAAFHGRPTVVYAKEAGMNEWTIDVGQSTLILGPGVPVV